jgi:hypothetical protein
MDQRPLAIAPVFASCSSIGLKTSGSPIDGQRKDELTLEVAIRRLKERIADLAAQRGTTASFSSPSNAIKPEGLG